MVKLEHQNIISLIDKAVHVYVEPFANGFKIKFEVIIFMEYA